METTVLYIAGYAAVCITAMILLEVTHYRHQADARHHYEESLGRLLAQVAILQAENDDHENEIKSLHDGIASLTDALERAKAEIASYDLSAFEEIETGR